MDQFFFSGTFRGGDPRFVAASKRVTDVSALQLLVAPYSTVHEDETHQWERRNELYEFIKSASRGHEFEPDYEVDEAQVLTGFQSWLDGAPPDHPLDRNDALPDEVDSWDSYFRIDVGRYMGDAELIRDLKRQSIEGLVDLFPDWRNSASTFQEDVTNELRAAGTGYLDAYLKYALRIGEGDYKAVIDSPIMSMMVQQMLHLLPDDMAPDEQLKQCARFFTSPHFASLPLHDIEAKAFATLKALVKAGAYANRDKALQRLKGFFFDLRHIASYAPYCDAFVMDQPMAELMSHPNVALEKRYGVRIFSLNNWDEFLAWLDSLKENMSAEHRAGLAAAYP